MSSCDHRWSMTDIRSGYLVVEGCYHCGARASYFSTEPVAPIEEYKEGDHFWEYRGSYQAVTFNLMCEKCGYKVDLSDMAGLMLSTCRDPECEVARLAADLPRGSMVYIALCTDSSHASGQCVSEAGIQALNEYFNQRLRSADKRIVVVPCRMCSDLDRCRGIVLADMGLTEL